jgi:hypothetical protein
VIAHAGGDDGPDDGARDMPGHDYPSARLLPGESCRISEAEWFHFLELAEPLHQWGAAFLFDEERAPPAARQTAGGPLRLVRVYLRDDGALPGTGEPGRHTCVRLDALRSAAARSGVERIEAASRDAADVITAAQRRPAQSVADMEAQEAASRRFVETAEGLYRELLGG